MSLRTCMPRIATMARPTLSHCSAVTPVSLRLAPQLTQHRLAAATPLQQPTPIRSLMTLRTPAVHALPLSAPVSAPALRSAPQHSALAAASAPVRAITTTTVSAASAVAPRPVRPTSPHVEIYRFPLPAITSITTRATGVALTVGTTGMALLALAGSCDIPSYVHAFQSAAPFLVPVAKLLVAFPVVFHYVAGARHIVWDTTAKGLDLQTTELTSQIIWGVSAFITLILAFVTL